MQRRSMIALMLVSLSSPALARPEAEPRVDPHADELLHRMSDYLAGLTSFRVTATQADESVAQDGQKVQFVASSRVAVRRPNKLRSDRLGPVADVTVRYDGNQVSVFGKRTGYYAVAPAPGKLDTAIDDLSQRLGIEAPAADLLSTNVYGALMQDVRTGRYIGLEPIEGTSCHHLAYQGKEVDWQIWIQDGPRPLPMRYVITSKDVRGQPEFTVALGEWEPNIPLSDDLFRFVPPPGATKIDFAPPAQPRHTRR